MELFNISAPASDPLATLFVHLFGFVVILFGGIYGWIGLHLRHPVSVGLVIIGAIGKSGVFLIMSSTAILTDVSWLSGPIFSFVDAVYAILFVEFCLRTNKLKADLFLEQSLPTT